MTAETVKSRTATRSRTGARRNADRVGGAPAAERLGFRYPDELNLHRWSLEQPFDPEDPGRVVPMPEEFRVVLLTRAQERALRADAGKSPEQQRTDADRLKAYHEKKEARIAWAQSQWMRVPAWGGRKAPNSDWSYSAAACTRWAEASTG